ncbi:MAG TPA: SOS response-associated peptidase family protein [Allosphingosinicella sp.]|jgi:putative SOS response-associated peptidase YedK|uniref:SOS response-associated peptidase family protein n=1 Tax=Allosphingosinicella sp. TaxID=2823234 RepID=UPI002F27DEA7
MCNEHRRAVALGEIATDFSQLRIPLRFPEGAPNLQALESIRITDPTAIVRAAADEPGAAELVQRRWSWPGPGGKPVFNYRSDGREFTTGRCLIVADGFYEYTDPPAPDGARGKRAKKDRWLFTVRGENWFCIAGLWRSTREVGEACTMLTGEPGPDVAPYHDRQVMVVPRSDWARWLDPAVPAREILKPSPAGTFDVRLAPC